MCVIGWGNRGVAIEREGGRVSGREEEEVGQIKVRMDKHCKDMFSKVVKL